MEQQRELFTSQETPDQGPFSQSRYSEEEQNVGRTERLVSGIIGGLLALRGVRKRSLLSGALGAVLLYRGSSGQCPMYKQMGISTKEEGGYRRPQSVRAHHAVTVNRSPEEVYSFWRDLENLPRIMPHIKSVTVLDERRSKWQAEVPSPISRTLEWHAEITTERPHELISWRSLPDSPVATDGRVSFRPSVTGSGTDVTLSVNYSLQTGALGEIEQRPFNLQQIFKKGLQKEVEQNLRAFKDFVEREEPTPSRIEVDVIQPQP